MPGTPATTPRHAIPRIASIDTDDVPRDINAAVDRIDVTAPVFGSGLLSGRPSAGAGIADRYYYATDAVRPDGGTGVLYRDAGGASPTWSAATGVPVQRVTSLPGSPVDGQEIHYAADSTNGVLWHLRYNASGGTYKWEYLGGSEFASAVATASVGSGAYTAPTGAACPSLTVPLAGDYVIEWGAGIANAPVAGVAYQYGVSISGANPVDPFRLTMQAAASTVEPQAGKQTALAVAASAALVNKISTANGAPSYANQYLRIRPIRVG